jgi:hypothetical protein
MKTEVILSKKEKRAQTRARLEKNQRIINSLERKNKLKKLIELGGIITTAGVSELTTEILFGALLEIKELSTNKDALKRWKGKQESWAQNNHAKRLIVKLLGEESPENTSVLKTRKFHWNAFRKEWYGFGNKEELQSVLTKDHVEIIEVTE